MLQSQDTLKLTCVAWSVHY